MFMDIVNGNIWTVSNFARWVGSTYIVLFKKFERNDKLLYLKNNLQ